MNAAELLKNLDYTESPSYFSSDDKGFQDAADFAHVFRRAANKLNLQGVYTLRQASDDSRDSIVPVVYVCEVDNEHDAHEIHQQVWNQNVVPFLIAVSPATIRLYSGFRYEKDGSSREAGVLGVAKEMSEALRLLDAFQSSKIDDGTVWQEWGNEVTPETRVDWKLLSHLEDLGQWLKANGIKDPLVAHGLIGKYVYLRYLRDREILSDKRLAGWDLNAKDIFSRNATLSAFWDVVDALDDWLNGSMFPLPRSGENSPRAKHIRKVAGVFSGDDPSGQLSLDFEVYDFSYIPIETISAIYEQFLHKPPKNKRDTSKSKGKELGAYYTPIPVVNFMLEELDAICPFEHGMKVLDPACGSGAFLVQTYRRIIEQDEEFDSGSTMRPARLRELLEEHIYGIDRDPDACRVAELSLILALLDYVDPPDLVRYSQFKLPDLHNSNIFEGDFFDPEATWREELAGTRFDWIVGNPPWVELKSNNISNADQHAWCWFKDKKNQKKRPTGGMQVAEAFTWEAIDWCDDQGRIAFLLPAMTLFKGESQAFRQSFFSEVTVECVANFANFSEVLFPGHRYEGGKRKSTNRARRPAAALFFGKLPNEDYLIPVYSPFVADSEANRAREANKRKDTWNVVPDASRIAYLEPTDISSGDSVPWKAAMWGSEHDVRFLSRIAGRFKDQTLLRFCENTGLDIAEGFQLREKGSSDETEPLPEVAGKLRLDMTALKGCGQIFTFPTGVLKRIPEEKAHIRKRGGRAGLIVSNPPHLIVDVMRRFAVYEDRFIAVPARQIGIAGKKKNSQHQRILKAIALFVISDFAKYHQFFVSPQWGISNSISTLDALKQLPLPLDNLSESDFQEWGQLHDAIIALGPVTATEKTLFEDPEGLRVLLNEVNNRVNSLLKLASHERHLISDLVHVRMELVQGKVSKDVIRAPEQTELAAYCRTLRDELDGFVDDQEQLKHKITVSKNGRSATVAIELLTDAIRKQQPKIIDVDAETEIEFAKIRQRVRKKHGQWFYFNRNLRMYEGNTTYVFKPLSRLHWTQSQALQDASAIIAETME